MFIAEPVSLEEEVITTIVSCITGSIFFSTQGFPRDGLRPTSHSPNIAHRHTLLHMVGETAIRGDAIGLLKHRTTSKEVGDGSTERVRHEDGEGSVPGWWWLSFGGTRRHDVTGQINKEPLPEMHEACLRSKSKESYINSLIRRPSLFFHEQAKAYISGILC